MAVGSKVTRFKPGDKVGEDCFTGYAHGIPKANTNHFFLQVVTLFNQGHLGGSLDGLAMKTGLGGVIDGTLREYGTFNESGLVDMPPSLNWLEASTLSCAAVTAWNALYGIKPLQPGDVVLTQGTGGVSIFAVQFAKAAGASVIATTSSAKKAEVLKKLGAGRWPRCEALSSEMTK